MTEKFPKFHGFLPQKNRQKIRTAVQNDSKIPKISQLFKTKFSLKNSTGASKFPKFHGFLPQKNRPNFPTADPNDRKIPQTTRIFKTKFSLKNPIEVSVNPKMPLD